MYYRFHIQSKFYKIIILICLSLYFCCLTSCVDKEKKQKENNTTKNIESPQKRNELTLVMAGDALLHSAVYNDAKYNLQNAVDSKVKQEFGYDFNKMFVDIEPIISKHDLAFYNQETILGGKELGLSSYPAFNSPQEFGDCMVKIGFNLVSLANNHTLDRGEKAIINSLQYWHNKPVLVSGSYMSLEDRNTPRIYEKNGITYTMLAYTYGTNGIALPKNKEYFVNVYTKEMLASDIANVRDKVDLLIVSMHWGNEYTTKPNKEQEELAKYLAGLGVDIVIGNHPHVVQPIEWIGHTLVIYSLGNMISAQKGLERRIGMLASVKVTKDSNSKQIALKDLSAQLIYTYYDKKFSNFKIYPFSLLNDSILPNYKQIYNEYLQIITQRDHERSIRTMPLL